MSAIQISETERNYAVFIDQLPDLIDKHQGQFVLLHAEKIEGFFSSLVNALSEGSKRFGEGNFSVQEVADEVESLGFYSYAGGSLQA